MIKFGDDRFHDLKQGEKIDNAIDLVERAAEFNGHTEVVTVQRFTDTARQKDEMSRTVDQIVARDADRVIRHVFVVWASRLR